MNSLESVDKRMQAPQPATCPYSGQGPIPDAFNQTSPAAPDAVAMMGPAAFERSPVRSAIRTLALPLLSQAAVLERRLTQGKEKNDRQPPGFRSSGLSSTLYGMTDLVTGDLVALMQGLYDRFGGGEKMLPVSFSFGGRPSVLVTHPRHIAMLKDTELFSPSTDPIVLKRFREALGFNLISVDHETWKHVRPRTVAYLSGEALDEYAAVMRRVTEEDCLPFWEACAAQKRPIDVWATSLALSARTAFEGFLRVHRENVPPEIHVLLSRLFGHVRRRIFRPSVLPQWLPLPQDVVYKKDMARMREFIAPYIDQQKSLDTMMGSIVRGHTTPRGRPNEARLADYIATALQGEVGDMGLQEENLARIRQVVAELVAKAGEGGVFLLARELSRGTIELARQTGRRLTLSPYRMEADLASTLCEGGEIDRELVLQEVISNLIGASETTIVQMTWGLHFLGAAHHIQDKLHAEVSSDREHRVLHSEPSTMRSKWPYLYNVLREILRVASPASATNRIALQDVDFDGFKVKKGTVIWGCQYITHRSPYLWNEPNRFIPERWDSPVDHSAFFPFSHGQRSCPGQNFAFLEAGILIGTVMKHFTCKTLSDAVGYDVDLTVRPAGPVMVQLERR